MQTVLKGREQLQAVIEPLHAPEPLDEDLDEPGVFDQDDL